MSEDLIKSVVGVLTRVPKRDLKNYFGRHCHANLKDVRHIQADWKVFSAAYDEFKATFANQVADSEFLQRIFVQLATVSAVMGKIDPDNDEFGLYGGCALFVSFWCERLSHVFFPACSDVAFFVLWSPFLRTMNVDWRFHGTPRLVLITLSQEVEIDEENEEPYAIVFPGPAPSVEAGEDGTAIGVQGWASKMRTLGGDLRDVFRFCFGLAGKLSSRQVQYFNPADDQFQCRRSYEDSWAIDVMPTAVEQFDQDEPEEDVGEYKEEMLKLQSLLAKAVVNPPSIEEAKANNQPQSV